MTEPKRYTVGFSAVAAKALGRLPANIVSRIRKAIDGLTLEPRPHGCKKLTGQGDKYRLRVGDWLP